MTTFLSLLEAPLDDYAVPDVGDVDVHGMPVAAALTATPLAATRSSSPALVLPYTRTLKLRSRGKDVVGARRAVNAALELGPTKSTSTLFGVFLARNVRRFQRRHGLAVDGQIGPETLRKLAPYFDRYGFLLYAGYPPGSSPRTRIVAYCAWGYSHRADLHYLQRRPMRDLGDLERLPEWEDCSEFGTKAYKFGGADDPNRNGFDGEGNTYEMRQHGFPVRLEDALPGDLVHYDDPQHVAVYVGGGRVVSFGSEIGPLLLPATYRRVAMVRRYF